MEEMDTVHGKDIIWSGEGNLWAIIILPDMIKIDNWYGPPHIHTNGEKKEISLNNPYNFFQKLYYILIVNIELF